MIDFPPALVFTFSIIGILLTFPVLHYITEHYFIRSLDQIARRLKMSSDIAGSTLMAAGSSTPELAIVLFAIFLPGQHVTLGIGTIVGSALFNLLVIVGLIMLIGQSRLIWQPLIRDLLLYVLSVVLLIVFYWDGAINIIEAGSFVVVYIFYIIIMFYWKKLYPYSDIESEIIGEIVQPKTKKNQLINFSEPIQKFEFYLLMLDTKISRNIPQIKNLYFSFFISISFITLLSWILVESAINISHFSGINEIYIGLIIIAVGTSIPDMFSSVIVAKQGRPGMAINNAIGSNIFDILIGLGVPLIILISITKEDVIVDRSYLVESFGLLSGSVVLLTGAFFVTKWRPKKIVGIILIGLYILFVLTEIYNIVFSK